jgi:hypothetical protein
MTTPTVTKKDLKYLIDNALPTTHYSMVLSELLEVFDDKPLTLNDMLSPFKNKHVVCQEPGTAPLESNGRYSVYIEPFYFATLVCCGSKNHRVMHKVFGLILSAYGHFRIPQPAAERFEKLWGRKWSVEEYWGGVELDENEMEDVRKRYSDFVNIRNIITYDQAGASQ